MKYLVLVAVALVGVSLAHPGHRKRGVVEVDYVYEDGTDGSVVEVVDYVYDDGTEVEVEYDFPPYQRRRYNNYGRYGSTYGSYSYGRKKRSAGAGKRSAGIKKRSADAVRRSAEPDYDWRDYVYGTDGYNSNGNYNPAFDTNLPRPGYRQYDSTIRYRPYEIIIN